MAKYKVLPIAMLVRGNKMAEHGEIIDGVNLLSNPEDLIKSGFIEEVKESKDSKKADAEAKAKADADNNADLESKK